MKSFRQYHEEKINAPKMSKESGVGDYLACMKSNGAKVINIYNLLAQIEQTKFPDTIFLGLEQRNNLLQAITNLAGGIHWTVAGHRGIKSSPGETSSFLNEAMKKNKKIMLFLPVDVNSIKLHTYKEVMWLADKCNDKSIMEKVTIVIGLYSIVSDEEMRSVSTNGYTSTIELMRLLRNWRDNISNKPPKPKFISKQPDQL